MVPELTLQYRWLEWWAKRALYCPIVLFPDRRFALNQDADAGDSKLSRAFDSSFAILALYVSLLQMMVSEHLMMTFRQEWGVGPIVEMS